MPKSKAMIEASFHRLYEGLWAKEAAGCSGAEWPKKVQLGRNQKKELEANFEEFGVLGAEWGRMAKSLGLGGEKGKRGEGRGGTEKERKGKGRKGKEGKR